MFNLIDVVVKLNIGMNCFGFDFFEFVFVLWLFKCNVLVVGIILMMYFVDVDGDSGIVL